MRIISGTAKGKRLATFKGEKIRPTSDRVREALFSILFSRLGVLQGKTVLDLFAGTGAMAIEALSRGARQAILVEQDPQAIRLITANLRSCAVAERAKLHQGDALLTIPRLGEGAFDLIFVDPPYRKGLAGEALEAISAHRLLAPGGLLCAETDRAESLPEKAGTLVLEERRLYGSTVIHIFSHPEASGP